jgi:pimeloyl-ACP methyl ester carboxylesterase
MNTKKLMLWIKRTAAVVAGLIVLAILTGVVYEQIMRRRAAEDYPAPGRLVDIGGRHMQIDCRGSGSPTVIFESGLDTLGSTSWSAVQGALAATTRACAYSRAGIMWSEPRRDKFEPDSVAHDLHALLTAAGEHAPYVMVGHSLGGPYIMNFTRLYPQEVAGLVFVDASHPDQIQRLNKAIGKKLDAGVGLLKTASVLSWTGIPRFLATQSESPGVPLQAKKAQNAYISVSLSAAMEELTSLDATLAAGGQLRQLGARPLVVLTAMKPFPASTLETLKMSEDQGRRMQAEWKSMQDDEASWSTHSRHQLVPDSSHYIQFGRPDLVIAAVREVVGDLQHAP